MQRNDEYKVYSQMADIFNKSSKFLEAEKIYKTLAKKFCKVKEVWIRFVLIFIFIIALCLYVQFSFVDVLGRFSSTLKV